MFSINVQEESLDGLIAELDALRDFKPDLSGLNTPIVRVVQEEHKKARLAGLDRFGKPLKELAPSTLQYRKGNGPPLAEHGEAARVVNNLLVDVEPIPSGIRISAHYTGMPWIKYHTKGAGRLPVRDVEGIQAEAEARVDRMVRDEIDNQVLAILNRRSQGFFGWVRSFFGKR